MENSAQSMNGQNNGSTSGPTINAERVAQLEGMVNLLQSDFVANAFTLRRELMTQFFDPRRNLYHECGYPEPRRIISAWDYQDLYDREPVAARVVGLMPQECWQTQPLIYEDEDPEIITSFEEGWDNLGASIRGEHSQYREEEGSPIWEYLRRADELSRIGHYGVVLIGIDDGLDLAQPAEGVEEVNSFPVEKEMSEEEVDHPLYEGQKSKQRVPSGSGGSNGKGNIRGSTVNYLRGKPEIIVNGRKRIPPYKLVSNFLQSSYQGTAGADYSETEGMGKDGKGRNGKGKDDKGKGKKGGNKLTYLRVFGEAQAQITSWESNPSSPRYGQPTSYLISFNDPRDDLGGVGYPLSTRTVHWTRVIHIADTHHQACSSEVVAVPVLRPVLNAILDIQKMRGGSAEGYWKMGIPGLTWESHPNLGTFKIDIDKARAQVEEWWNGMQRMLLSMGGSFKTLAPTVTDPTPFIDLQIKHICIQSGVPKRVFEGSERGELASSQDERAHTARVKQRRHNYLIPRVLIPFIDRLILLGCLPAPAKKGGQLNIKEQPLKPESDQLIQGEKGDEELLPKEGDEPLEMSKGGNEGDSVALESGVEPAVKKKPPFASNAFCPTGEGGGVDPSCSASEKSIPVGGGNDTMVEAISLTSPSGKMSKRARDAAEERLRVSIFGEKGLEGPKVKQPEKVDTLRRQAKELRALAERGMKPRAYRKKADELEAEADKLSGNSRVDNAEPVEGAEGDEAKASEFPFKPSGKPGMAKPERGKGANPFSQEDPEGLGLDEEGLPEETYEAPGGYCIEWPDSASQNDTEQAAICSQNTASLTAYLQGQGQALIPEINYLTHPKFLGMDEEEARQMLEEAARVEEEELAEQQLQAEEFGFQPEAPEGMIDPEQADRELELAEGKMEVDKERAKAGLPSGPPPQLQGKPGGPEFSGKPKGKPAFPKNSETLTDNDGGWVTLESGQHVWTDEGGISPGGPSGEKVGGSKAQKGDKESKPVEKATPTKPAQSQPQTKGQEPKKQPESEKKSASTPATEAKKPVKDHATANKEWRKSLSKQERSSIEDFSSNEYKSIRDCQNNGKNCSPKIKEHIKTIQGALERAPKFEGKVHRGLRFSSDRDLAEFVAKVKKEGGLTDKGFTSTTQDLDIAKAFAGVRGSVGAKYQRSVVMTINNKTGVDISGLSLMGEEKEVLRQPGTKLRLNKVRKVKGVIYMDFDE